MPAITTCDVAIVGGGLAGGLIALALKRKRPHCDVRIIESVDMLGGNHLWSYFATDIAPANRWMTAKLTCHGWSSYDVAFPAHRRRLNASYYSIESHRLDSVLRAALPAGAILSGRKAVSVSKNIVILDDGDRIEAGGVIDCRGAGDLSTLDCGWQKFYGREIDLATTHDVARPIIMDATVSQEEGYRFVYTLPFGVTRLFLEDTYYSDTPDLDADLLGKRLDDYAVHNGWPVDRIMREETGVLPVVMGGNFDDYWQSSGKQVAKAGMRAGLFHPLTSYSLPDAARTAALVANASDLSGDALHTLLHGFAKSTWKKRRYYRMLTKMLFKAADPADRYRILERFYRLSPDLIGRFYAGNSSAFDKLRILTGKPPVPIGRAVRALTGK